MKHINRFKKLVPIVCTVIFTLGIASVASAGVSSLKNNAPIKIGEQRYESVSIECSTTASQPTLLRREGSRQWCDSTIVSACYFEKLKAAQFVCSKSYSRKLKSVAVSQNTEADNSAKVGLTVDFDALNIEKLKIEKAIRTIQAKRLALTKRESVLQRKMEGF